jgi:deoxyribonuclease V
VIATHELLPTLSRRPDGRWDLSTARAVQERWRGKVVRSDSPRKIRRVGGADVSYGRRDERARAAVVVLDPETLDVLEESVWEGHVEVPYVPGYLSFREAPAILGAWERLRVPPDLLMVDGQGVAHPRRFGLACHLGLLLDVPTVGVAKSVLVGESGTIDGRRGARAPLVHRGERVGTALRTRDGVAPVYVSVGHRISLRSAERWVLRCGAGFRLPEPTRRADRLVATRS